jgi:hypothetical protein
MKNKNLKKVFYKGLFRVKGNKIIEGVHIIKVHYIYVWKYHSETPYFVQ